MILLILLAVFAAILIGATGLVALLAWLVVPR